MDQVERPQYYEGQYLGADDLAAIVRYARIGQARHALGAHQWGIAIGLDLVERALSGGDVEMVLTPGFAWDGYGRGLVALAPQRLTLDQLANFQDATAADGDPIEVWLTYRELAAKPPGVGFACPDDQLRERVVESFSFELRRVRVTDSHSVSVAARSLDASNAQKAFDAAKAPLYDESVPQQAFPESGDVPRWPVFVGIVRWVKVVGQPGKLIKRKDGDRNDARARRRYLGAVAETIAAPDGVLRLRDRSKDPSDPDVNFNPPIVAAPANTTVVNDLVWCEGHLRVVGDVRLQDGKLDFRVKQGGNAGVPMYLRRVGSAQPKTRTTLEAAIGNAVDPTSLATRFAVSALDAKGDATEKLTVVASEIDATGKLVPDGRVGINAPDPSNTLQVSGPSGIRHGAGYISGDSGKPWTSFAYNAYYKDGDKWQFPDPTHKSAAIEMDDDGGVPTIRMFTNLTTDPTKWDLRMIVKGDSGNVGISSPAPRARLEVLGNADQYGTALFVPAAAKGTNASHVHWDTTGDWYIRSAASAGKVVIQDTGGNVGLGTAAPRAKLEISGNADIYGTTLFLPAAAKGTNASHVHWDITGDWYIRSANSGGKVVIQDTGGFLNIGTSANQCVMQLNGDAFMPDGSGIWTTSDREQKKDIAPIEQPLNRLLALQGMSFAWRALPKQRAPGARHVGFIAQDVEMVFPEWVKTAPNGNKAINTHGIGALTVEAVRELATKVDALETELVSLKRKLAGSRPGPDQSPLASGSRRATVRKKSK
jgi:hypothetical protein